MFCKSDERHYYRAKVEFINLNGDFEKYYPFGISSTQTSEIINGVNPGTGTDKPSVAKEYTKGAKAYTNKDFLQHQENVKKGMEFRFAQQL